MEFNLSGYLNKLQTLLPYETRVRNAVVAVVEEEFHTTLSRKSIKVSGPRVFIQASSIIKSEIILRKEKILSKIKERDPLITISNIS